jgi:hypothetical protein
MRKKIFFCFSIYLFFTFSANAAPTNPSKVVVVLFDISGSTTIDRDLYIKEFTKILAAINPGDALLVDKITDNPMAQSEFPIQEEFPAVPGQSENPLWHKARVRKNAESLEKKKAEIKGRVKTLVSVGATKLTDIFGALSIAERVFRSFGREKRILVLISDMLQESQACNFKKEKYAGGSAAGIIDREKQTGRLPGLKGVKVYVSGAYADDSGAFNRLFRFWQMYFQAAGAFLAEENFGRVLLTFRE